MSCYGINKENKCYAEVYTMEESKMMAYKPNLLLNGDFKVNQGGQLVYENPAYTAQDSIDKWKIMAGKVNTSFVNYLTIESYNETGSSYFLQNFDSDKSGDFVISIKVLNINKGSFRVYFEGTNQQDSYTISSKGIYKITFRDVKNATGVCLALDNFSGDIEYIRLDEGTVPLPHMKEDYEIALARCGAVSELNEKIVDTQNDVSDLKSKDVLWENPSPTNGISELTVTVTDMTPYRFIYVTGIASTTSTDTNVNTLIYVGVNNGGRMIITFSDSMCCARGVTIRSNTSVYIGAIVGSKGSNSHIIPTKIIGIK